MAKVVWANYPISRVVTHQAGSSMRLTWCFERNGEVLRLETGTAQQTGEYFVARRDEGGRVKTERYTRYSEYVATVLALDHRLAEQQWSRVDVRASAVTGNRQ